jgi:hypothetical protein
MEFRGVPERLGAPLADSVDKVLYGTHLNTQGVNPESRYIGDDIPKAGLFGDPDKGTLLFVDKYGESLPQCSKSGLVTLFLTHLDRPPACVVDFSPPVDSSWTLPGRLA